MTVGYVGLGAMGRALAGNLIGKHDLMVWDLNPQAVADFVARGARAANSLADMGAHCDVVILCLPKSANVEQALFGPDGLAAHMAAGSTIVDQTSGMPAASRDFAQRLGAMGITLIDAPVAGGVPSAIAGQITIMASGAASAFDRALPVLSAISPKVFRCSDQVGDGQAVKAINNMINAGYRMVTLELLAMGRRLGLSAAAITDALNAGEGRSFISYRLLPAVVARASSTDFAMSLMVKDLNQAAELGIATGAAMPISDAARGLMHAALNLMGADSRLDDVVSFMERITQTQFAGDTAAPVAGITPDEAMVLVTGALAACNRAIMLENIALAVRAGLGMAGFAPVITAGSASSRQAERLFAAMLGEGTLDGGIGDAVAVLNRIARLGADLGVPLVMTNQVRAQYLALADRIGGDGTLNALIKDYTGGGKP